MDRAAKKKGDLLTVAIPARYGPPCRIGAQVAIEEIKTRREIAYHEAEARRVRFVPMLL